MQVERKALYNSLRLNWLKDSTIKVEYWQVDDYRNISLDELFDLLHNLEVKVDHEAFISYAENFDSPEELAQCFIGDDTDIIRGDQIYLLVFELWRRLLPHKQSLSIFCDELDYQIHFYDRGEGDIEAIQDILLYLEEILHENADEGEDSFEVFQWITACCAHDVAAFLYDFISSQIEEGNYNYSTELLEGFYDFVGEDVWFDFLRARLASFFDVEEFNDIIADLIEDSVEELDLELYFEIFHALSKQGRKQLFLDVAKRIQSLIETEEDFCDLLEICLEYSNRCGDEDLVTSVQDILFKRKSAEEKVEWNVDSDRLFSLLDRSFYLENR